MRRFVILMAACFMMLVGLMVLGEANAETAMDFESLNDCMTKMGYETFEVDSSIIEGYLANCDKEEFIESFTTYIRQTVGLEDNEDMMILSIGDGPIFPAAGLVYDISEKGLRMAERTILRVVLMESK